ncbi:MAG: RNA polymerase sigma-54 factor, partial [Haliangium ochraceum]
MSIEIKQHLKLSQQLVMTPQLQQAIKLLQLSRMELVDMVREEMLENPILEDGGEAAAEPAKMGDNDAEMAAAAERVGETELPAMQASVENPAATQEVKADTRADEAVSEFDWESYLDNQAMAAPMPSQRPNSEDMPSLEATLTKGTSLFDHLEWQLKLGHFTREEDGVGMLIIG